MIQPEDTRTEFLPFYGDRTLHTMVDRLAKEEHEIVRQRFESLRRSVSQRFRRLNEEHYTMRNSA